MKEPPTTSLGRDELEWKLSSGFPRWGSASGLRIKGQKEHLRSENSSVFHVNVLAEGFQSIKPFTTTCTVNELRAVFVRSISLSEVLPWPGHSWSLLQSINSLIQENRPSSFVKNLYYSPAFYSVRHRFRCYFKAFLPCVNLSFWSILTFFISI